MAIISGGDSGGGGVGGGGSGGGGGGAGGSDNRFMQIVGRFTITPTMPPVNSAVNITVQLKGPRAREAE